MLTDWTGLSPVRTLRLSRVRVYFPDYSSFNEKNISGWSRMYRHKWYNFDHCGYPGVSGDKK
jgi:hypothetical protein